MKNSVLIPITARHLVHRALDKSVVVLAVLFCRGRAQVIYTDGGGLRFARLAVPANITSCFQRSVVAADGTRKMAASAVRYLVDAKTITQREGVRFLQALRKAARDVS